jgi:outer membrane murein-binding lipoprotein Lpp
VRTSGGGINDAFKQQVGQCLLQACLGKGQSVQEAKKTVAACDVQELNADQVRCLLKVLATAWSAVRVQAGL